MRGYGAFAVVLALAMTLAGGASLAEEQGGADADAATENAKSSPAIFSSSAIA